MNIDLCGLYFFDSLRFDQTGDSKRTLQTMNLSTGKGVRVRTCRILWPLLFYFVFIVKVLHPVAVIYYCEMSSLSRFTAFIWFDSGGTDMDKICSSLLPTCYLILSLNTTLLLNWELTIERGNC